MPPQMLNLWYDGREVGCATQEAFSLAIRERLWRNRTPLNLLRRWTAGSTGVADPEGQLVVAARQGDRRAFDALVGAHQSQLRGFLMRRVGPGAADDVLQETLVACWTALARFDGRSRFKTWLYGIALHKCADYARAQKRIVAMNAADSVEDAGQSVEDLYAAAELRETMHTLLAQLPPAQREVVEMYYFAELTLPEIATALGRNLNTVKYQFYRAHAQVATHLEAPPPPAHRHDGLPRPSGVPIRP